MVDPVIASASARMASTGRSARPTSTKAMTATRATRAGSPITSARRRASTVPAIWSTGTAPVTVSRPLGVST
jgi:hypothetical protein